MPCLYKTLSLIWFLLYLHVNIDRENNQIVLQFTVIGHMNLGSCKCKKLKFMDPLEM